MIFSLHATITDNPLTLSWHFLTCWKTYQTSQPPTFHTHLRLSQQLTAVRLQNRCC